ncbi:MULTISPECIES: lysophospholipid acyltransferase family protein [Clostridium]|uniref:1-acyl-sn-glycerol-3-phosphate acyltransferase n=1 Tax=Clostridium senegalense TaxID=1465809 RepID=A0A6M0H1V2_9CLOT|nr:MULTISPECIES: lysophospholipid acyltransferase family protein [Clostridium]NEU04706.1 1-acyl-sn-glycerol-3-phosphate acyltransferase [Clostridium senegalense]
MSIKSQMTIVGKLPKPLRVKVIRKKVDEYIDKYANLKVEGKENLKGIEGPIIFISNHLSNSDGIFINNELEEYKPVFVAGEKLSHNKFTSLILELIECVMIKPNSADKDAIAAVINKLKSGRNIMIFPEGTRSRDGKMIEAKKGIILIAKLTKATIVPIGLTDTEKFLPINPEGSMEEEKICSANVTMKIGKPFKLPAKTKEETREEYHTRAMWEIMTSISKLLPEEYRGYYSL